MLRDINSNPIMFTDSYNTSHEELKINTDWEVSHIYNRAKGMFLHGFIENIVEKVLSVTYTKDMVEKAFKNAKAMNIVFPKEMWMRVVNECDGRLPLMVECLPEGTWCPTGTPYAQVRNTIKGFGELVTWFEAPLLHYFPSACLTRVYDMRKYLEDKGLPLNRFHSFGLRGHKSLEDAYWAGTAWSMMLPGTDDFHIRQHLPEGINMGSISALAHKVTQQYDDEYACFINAIDKASENGTNIVALVIDTYSAKNVIKNWVIKLAKYAKEKGVFIVFRPDSGDLFEQVAEIHSLLKAYGLLNNAAVIAGEGMSLEKIIKFDIQLEEYGIPLAFVSYGIGAGFYKDIERDTHGQAMKTAFSNGAPRMKLVGGDEFKMSIPNVVHLIHDINGNLVVMDGESTLVRSVYEVIYNCDEKELYCHKPNERDFTKTVDRVFRQNTGQEKIILSDETKALIETFKEKYGKSL